VKTELSGLIMTNRKRSKREAAELSKQASKNPEVPASDVDSGFTMSDGEVHYLWYFIQGSIMDPFTRHWLRRAWGFCERHAAVYLVVDCAYHQIYLHGAAILYEDLFLHAQLYFKRYSMVPVALHMRLSNRRKCPMCELGYDEKSRSFATEETLKRGRDLTNLRELSSRTSVHWKQQVCEMCLGKNEGQHLCRQHFLHESSYIQIKGLELQRQHVTYLADQLIRYSRSFQWEYRDTGTLENEASIISAIGWCSGWGHLLKIL